MTPRVNQLEELSTAVKKVLRSLKHIGGIPDGAVPPELVAKAGEMGLPVESNLTLQELLGNAQRMIQAEILSEFQRAFDSRPPVHRVRGPRTRISR